MHVARTVRLCQIAERVRWGRGYPLQFIFAVCLFFWATTMPVRSQPLIVPPPLSAAPKRQAFLFVLIIIVVRACANHNICMCLFLVYAFGLLLFDRAKPPSPAAAGSALRRSSTSRRGS